MDPVENLPLGNYTFGWYIIEFVGGIVDVYNATHYMVLEGGNPGLYLPQSLINQFAIRTIQLPDRQYFQDIVPASYPPGGMQYLLGGGIKSTVNLTDPQCQTTASGMNLIGVFPNNDQWYYDARVVLDQNTIDKPIPDGGGDSGTLCSNVAKNFLNRKCNSNIMKSIACAMYHKSYLTKLFARDALVHSLTCSEPMYLVHIPICLPAVFCT
jgi:hypothetical protein